MRQNANSFQLYEGLSATVGHRASSIGAIKKIDDILDLSSTPNEQTKPAGNKKDRWRRLGQHKNSPPNINKVIDSPDQIVSSGKHRFSNSMDARGQTSDTSLPSITKRLNHLTELKETGVLNNKFLQKHLGNLSPKRHIDASKNPKGNKYDAQPDDSERSDVYDVNMLNKPQPQNAKNTIIMNPTNEFLSLKQKINEKLSKHKHASTSPGKRPTIDVTPWIENAPLDVQIAARKPSPKKPEPIKFKSVKQELKRHKKNQSPSSPKRKQQLAIPPKTVGNFPRIPDVSLQANYNNLHQSITRELDEQFLMFKMAKKSNFAKAEVLFSIKEKKEGTFQAPEDDLPLSFMVKKAL